MADFDSVVQKILSDSDFCSELATNPEAALRSLGVEPTPEIIAALKGLDAASINRLAAAFGKQHAAGLGAPCSPRATADERELPPRVNRGRLDFNNQIDIAPSSMCGYHAIRLIDDVVDRSPEARSVTCPVYQSGKEQRYTLPDVIRRRSRSGSQGAPSHRRSSRGGIDWRSRGL